ncbi:MAG: OsmC family protein [Bacteroidetes bacterium]|nr:OsmC family protein [Bacteroidota bacterium]
MQRKSSAVWQGTGMEGKGSLTSTSNVLNNTPYSFQTRFKSEDGKAGTNPEELIAAAHAGCYSMALSFQLGGAGFPPTELKTDAILTMENEGGHFVIKGIHLELLGVVPNITEEKFIEIANNAKSTCPVSKALSSLEITLTATLKK